MVVVDRCLDSDLSVQDYPLYFSLLYLIVLWTFERLQIYVSSNTIEIKEGEKPPMENKLSNKIVAWILKVISKAIGYFQKINVAAHLLEFIVSMP